MESNVLDKQAETKSANQASTGTKEAFVRNLATIQRSLKNSKNLKKAMKQIEGAILDLFNAKLFTIYQSVDNGKEIVASFKGGIGSDEGGDIEIRCHSVQLL